MRTARTLFALAAALLPAACTVPAEDFVANEEEPGPDVEVVEIDVRETGLNLKEGRGAELGLRLRKAPTAPVVVKVTVDAADAVALSTTELRFTADDWDKYQVVTVTAVEDDDVHGETTGVSLRVEAAGLTVPVAVRIDDNDTQALQLSLDEVALNEESSLELTARLAFQPLGPVGAGVRSTTDGLEVETARLAFTPANWRTPQPIKLRALKDADGDSETGTLRIATDDGMLVMELDAKVTDVVRRASHRYSKPTYQLDFKHSRFHFQRITIDGPLLVDTIYAKARRAVKAGARVAIYGPSAGDNTEPGALLVVSPDIDLVETGREDHNYSSVAITPTQLEAAGTYWFGVQYDGREADGVNAEKLVQPIADLSRARVCSVEGLAFGAAFPTAGWTCHDQGFQMNLGIEGDRHTPAAP